MRLVRQFGVALLIGVFCLTPVMACSNSAVTMTATERACCRMMHNACEQMQMPGSPNCCETTQIGPHDFLVEARITVNHIIPVTAIGLATLDRFHTAPVVAGLFENVAFSPPKSPPASFSILRI